MITYSELKFINENINADVNRLRLTYHGNSDMAHAINQIECRQRTVRKLSHTISQAPEFEFPSVLAAEQSTSDSLARFHAELCSGTNRVLDMTCGLGIDAFHIAEVAKSVTAYEQNPDTAKCAIENAKLLNLDNITIECSDSVERLKLFPPDSFDCIFIDPARRGEYGKRLFALADCSPDVTTLLTTMLEVAPEVIIKASPMLDVSHTVSELKNVSHVMAVGTTRECKELVVICKRNFTDRPVYCSYTLTNDKSHGYSYNGVDEINAPVFYGNPQTGQILFEPYPSTMKMAPLKLLSAQFKVSKLGPNSHLYLSDKQIADFPGRMFSIEDVVPFNRSGIKKLKDAGIAPDITTRNFPLSSEALSKKLKLKQKGTDCRLFATKDASDSPVLIITKPIN